MTFYTLALFLHIVGALGLFVALVLLAVLGAALSSRRMAALGRAAAAERGPVSPALHDRLTDRLLWISIQTRVAIALGIVFLMAVKPDLGGALLTIGAAVVLRLVATVPMWRRDRARPEEALP